MTECPDGLMRDLLPEYVHGTLPADAAARVDRHLEACAS
ncbi:MAG: zf-HC2 domain-containing protein, partial [Gemmatimonadaceae bacterium]